MEQWFFTVEIPDILFKTMNAEEMEGVSGVPMILFRENGMTVQSINGAISRADLISKIRSIWPE
jgi:hypothetical protein